MRDRLNTFSAKHNETLARTKRRKQQRPTDPKHGDHRTTAQQTQRRKPTARGQPTNTRSQNKDRHQPEPDNPQATRTNRSRERDRSRSLRSSHALNPPRHAQARHARTCELQRGSSTDKAVIDKARDPGHRPHPKHAKFIGFS